MSPCRFQSHKSTGMKLVERFQCRFMEDTAYGHEKCGTDEGYRVDGIEVSLHPQESVEGFGFGNLAGEIADQDADGGGYDI